MKEDLQMAEKFCAGCGAAIKEDTVFCPQCGAKQPEAAEAVTETVTEAAAEAGTGFVPEDNGGAAQGGINPELIKKYGPIIGIGLVILIAIIVAISLIVSAMSYTKIDGKELCRVTFSGINGEGKAEAGFAFDPAASYYADGMKDYFEKDSALYEYLSTLDDKDYDEYKTNAEENPERYEKYEKLDYSKYLTFDKKALAKAFEKADSKSDAEDMRDAVLDGVSFDISEDSGLSNGDKLTVTLDIDKDDLKDNKIKITNTEFEITVKDLIEGEELDVFEGVKLSCSGYEGDSDISIDVSGAPAFVQNNFGFYIESDSYSCSNGDKLTVSANFRYYVDYDDENGGAYDENKEHFYLFETENTKELEVSGLTELQEVEVFDYVEISYEGTLPDISVRVDWKDDAPDYLRDSVNIYADYDRDNITDGGTFKLTASEWKLKDYGYKLASAEKEYTFDFSQVPAYITADKVKKDTYSAPMDAEAKTKAESYIGKSSWDFDDLGTIDSVDKVAYKTTYVKINKDQSDWWYAKNVVTRVYEVTCKHTKDDKQAAGKFYVAAYVTNVTVTGDVFADIDASSISYKVSDKLEDIVEDLGTSDDTFDVTEVK